MSYSEIVETRGNWRVVLHIEEGPDEPYDDRQSPLLRLDTSGRYRSGTVRATHVMATGRPTYADARIEEAAERFDGELSMLEKYLRAYHGTTQFVTWSSEDYTYVSYDTPAWREYIGFDGKTAPMDGLPEGAVNLDEYQAWCEGEVYWYVVEKRAHWTTEDEEIEDKERDTWEHVDSCGGYYGAEWAEEAAKEALDDHAPRETAEAV
jgi:hypothetical protein